MTDPSLMTVSGLRHDLRTPVNHIVGYAEMLLEELDGPPDAAPRRALQETLDVNFFADGI